MGAQLRKKRLKRPLFLQITFAALAFIMMVVLSYLFMSQIVHRHLVHNAENVLAFEQEKIEQVLQKPEAMLGTFSQTIRSMISRGEGIGTLRRYVTEITEYLMSSIKHMAESDGFYGYFETPAGEAAYISGTGWVPPDDYVPQSRPWYIAAVEAGGSIVATTPYVDIATGKPVFTFTRCLYDGDGRQLGVACLNVPVSIIGDDVVATALSQGGYGLLLSQDLTILAHLNDDFVGRDLRDPDIPVSVFAEDLQGGVEISERAVISFTGEPSIVFFRRLQNGWYVGLVTPKGPYFQSVTTMALILSLLGFVLAVTLVCVLVRIDTARAKSDAESRQKTAFLASMSHEMRTPLNAIIGLSELTLEGGGLSEEAGLNLEKIYSAGATLLSTVNDILDISKIEAGRLELLPVDYDIPSLINDAVTQSIMRIGEKPIHFSLDISDDMPTRLFGDDLRIKQLLNNLLSNAFKYTREGTVELFIRCKREHPGDSVWMTIRVSDTGVGIRQEDINYLFSDYSQIDKRSNRQIEGTGLGLSITKRIAEMMDGSISVESEYGKGSTFTVKIRQKFVSDAVIGSEVVKNLKELEFSENKRNQNSRLNRVRLPYARVLVVDDVGTNLDVARGMMKPYGMQIDCAGSGQEAIDAVRAEAVRYDAIFMDHMMPGMDGVEATRIIREEIGTEYARTVPIIALTANAIVGNDEMFLSKGFQAFLSKPIEVTRLDAVVREWVRDAEKEKQLADKLVEVGGEKVLDARKGEDRRQVSGDRRGGHGEPVFEKKIDAVDIDKGMRRFGKDWKIYVKILHSFANSIRPLLEKIRVVTRDNLADYAITVHGIKGSSRSICADSIGDHAEMLEKAAKEGDIDFVIANNPAFIAAVEKLLNDLEKALVPVSISKPKKDKPEQEKLDRLLAACSAFNIDKADAVMEEIEIYEYESDDGLVPWLRENVSEANFTQITERLSALPK